MIKYFLIFCFLLSLTACDTRIDNKSDSTSDSNSNSESQSTSESSASNITEIPYTGTNEESKKLSDEIYLYLLYLTATNENQQVVNLTIELYQEWLSELNNAGSPVDIRQDFETWQEFVKSGTESKDV